ncbi:MAG: hypothetical protein EXR08_11995 [Alphaproteobacteria bacterium]|nr:hypothetical protein [Alphaproteobacteria bacterium]
MRKTEKSVPPRPSPPIPACATDYCQKWPPESGRVSPRLPYAKPAVKWVIHVRCAHYLNDDEPEQKMRQAIESMLRAVGENNIRSVAMPAIGIGVFKFPIALAAQITAQACLSAFG